MNDDPQSIQMPGKSLKEATDILMKERIVVLQLGIPKEFRGIAENFFREGALWAAQHIRQETVEVPPNGR